MLTKLARTPCHAAFIAALMLLLASSLSYAQRMTGELSGTEFNERKQ